MTTGLSPSYFATTGAQSPGAGLHRKSSIGEMLLAANLDYYDERLGFFNHGLPEFVEVTQRLNIILTWAPRLSIQICCRKRKPEEDPAVDLPLLANAISKAVAPLVIRENPEEVERRKKERFGQQTVSSDEATATDKNRPESASLHGTVKHRDILHGPIVAASEPEEEKELIRRRVLENALGELYEIAFESEYLDPITAQTSVLLAVLEACEEKAGGWVLTESMSGLAANVIPLLGSLDSECPDADPSISGDYQTLFLARTAQIPNPAIEKTIEKHLQQLEENESPVKRSAIFSEGAIEYFRGLCHEDVSEDQREQRLQKVMDGIEEMKIPPFIRDDGGRTLLHWAVDWSESFDSNEGFILTVIRFLLELGLSPLACDHSGSTPLDVALRRPVALRVFKEIVKQQQLRHQHRYGKAAAALPADKQRKDEEEFEVEDDGTKKGELQEIAVLPPLKGALFEVPAGDCAQAIFSATQRSKLFVVSQSRSQLLLWDVEECTVRPVYDFKTKAPPVFPSASSAHGQQQSGEDSGSLGGTTSSAPGGSSTQQQQHYRVHVIPYHSLYHGTTFTDMLLCSDGTLIGVSYVHKEPEFAYCPTGCSFDVFGGESQGYCCFLSWKGRGAATRPDLPSTYTGKGSDYNETNDAEIQSKEARHRAALRVARSDYLSQLAKELQELELEDEMGDKQQQHFAKQHAQHTKHHSSSSPMTGQAEEEAQKALVKKEKKKKELEKADLTSHFAKQLLLFPYARASQKPLASGGSQQSQSPAVTPRQTPRLGGGESPLSGSISPSQAALQKAPSEISFTLTGESDAPTNILTTSPSTLRLQAKAVKSALADEDAHEQQLVELATKGGEDTEAGVLCFSAERRVFALHLSARTARCHATATLRQRIAALGKAVVQARRQSVVTTIAFDPPVDDRFETSLQASTSTLHTVMLQGSVSSFGKKALGDTPPGGSVAGGAGGKGVSWGWTDAKKTEASTFVDLPSGIHVLAITAATESRIYIALNDGCFAVYDPDARKFFEQPCPAHRHKVRSSLGGRVVLPLSGPDVATSVVAAAVEGLHYTVWCGKNCYINVSFVQDREEVVGDGESCTVRDYVTEPSFAIRDSELDSEVTAGASSPADPFGVYLSRRGELIRVDLKTLSATSLFAIALSPTECVERFQQGDGTSSVSSGLQQISFNVDGSLLLRWSSVYSCCAVYNTTPINQRVDKEKSMLVSNNTLICGVSDLGGQHVTHCRPKERLKGYLSQMTSAAGSRQARVDHVYSAVAAMESATSCFDANTEDKDGRVPAHLVGTCIDYDDLLHDVGEQFLLSVLRHGGSLYHCDGLRGMVGEHAAPHYLPSSCPGDQLDRLRTPLTNLCRSMLAVETLYNYRSEQDALLLEEAIRDPLLARSQLIQIGATPESASSTDSSEKAKQKDSSQSGSLDASGSPMSSVSPSSPSFSTEAGGLAGFQMPPALGRGTLSVSPTPSSSSGTSAFLVQAQQPMVGRGGRVYYARDLTLYVRVPHKHKPSNAVVTANLSQGEERTLINNVDEEQRNSPVASVHSNAGLFYSTPYCSVDFPLQSLIDLGENTSFHVVPPLPSPPSQSQQQEQGKQGTLCTSLLTESEDLIYLSDGMVLHVTFPSLEHTCTLPCPVVPPPQVYSVRTTLRLAKGMLSLSPLMKPPKKAGGTEGYICGALAAALAPLDAYSPASSTLRPSEREAAIAAAAGQSAVEFGGEVVFLGLNWKFFEDGLFSSGSTNPRTKQQEQHHHNTTPLLDAFVSAVEFALITSETSRFAVQDFQMGDPSSVTVASTSSVAPPLGQVQSLSLDWQSSAAKFNLAATWFPAPGSLLASGSASPSSSSFNSTGRRHPHLLCATMNRFQSQSAERQSVSSLAKQAEGSTLHWQVLPLPTTVHPYFTAAPTASDAAKCYVTSCIARKQHGVEEADEDDDDEAKALKEASREESERSLLVALCSASVAVVKVILPPTGHREQQQEPQQEQGEEEGQQRGAGSGSDEEDIVIQMPQQMTPPPAGGRPATLVPTIDGGGPFLPGPAALATVQVLELVPPSEGTLSELISGRWCFTSGTSIPAGLVFVSRSQNKQRQGANKPKSGRADDEEEQFGSDVHFVFLREGSFVMYDHQQSTFKLQCKCPVTPLEQAYMIRDGDVNVQGLTFSARGTLLEERVRQLQGGGGENDEVEEEDELVAPVFAGGIHSIDFVYFDGEALQETLGSLAAPTTGGALWVQRYNTCHRVVQLYPLSFALRHGSANYKEKTLAALPSAALPQKLRVPVSHVTTSSAEDRNALADKRRLLTLPKRTVLLKGVLARSRTAGGSAPKQLKQLELFCVAIESGFAPPGQRDADGRTAFNMLDAVAADISSSQQLKWVRRLLGLSVSPLLCDGLGRAAADSPRIAALLQKLERMSNPSAEPPLDVVSPLHSIEADTSARATTTAAAGTHSRVVQWVWSPVLPNVAYILYADGAVSMFTRVVGVESQQEEGRANQKMNTTTPQPQAGVLVQQVLPPQPEGRRAMRVTCMHPERHAVPQPPEGTDKNDFLPVADMFPTDALLFNNGSLAICTHYSPLDGNETVVNVVEKGSIQWFVGGNIDEADDDARHRHPQLASNDHCGMDIVWYATADVTSTTTVVGLCVLASSAGQVTGYRYFMPPGLTTVFPRHIPLLHKQAVPFVLQTDIPGWSGSAQLNASTTSAAAFEQLPTFYVKYVQQPAVFGHHHHGANGHNHRRRRRNHKSGKGRRGNHATEQEGAFFAVYGNRGVDEDPFTPEELAAMHAGAVDSVVGQSQPSPSSASTKRSALYIFEARSFAPVSSLLTKELVSNYLSSGARETVKLEEAELQREIERSGGSCSMSQLAACYRLHPGQRVLPTVEIGYAFAVSGVGMTCTKHSGRELVTAMAQQLPEQEDGPLGEALVVTDGRLSNNNGTTDQQGSADIQATRVLRAEVNHRVPRKVAPQSVCVPCVIRRPVGEEALATTKAATSGGAPPTTAADAGTSLTAVVTAASPMRTTGKRSPPPRSGSGATTAGSTLSVGPRKRSSKHVTREDVVLFVVGSTLYSYNVQQGTLLKRFDCGAVEGDVYLTASTDSESFAIVSLATGEVRCYAWSDVLSLVASASRAASVSTGGEGGGVGAHGPAGGGAHGGWEWEARQTSIDSESPMIPTSKNAPLSVGGHDPVRLSVSTMGSSSSSSHPRLSGSAASPLFGGPVGRTLPPSRSPHRDSSATGTGQIAQTVSTFPTAASGTGGSTAVFEAPSRSPDGKNAPAGAVRQPGAKQQQEQDEQAAANRNPNNRVVTHYGTEQIEQQQAQHFQQPSFFSSCEALPEEFGVKLENLLQQGASTVALSPARRHTYSTTATTTATQEDSIQLMEAALYGLQRYYALFLNAVRSGFVPPWQTDKAGRNILHCFLLLSNRREALQELKRQRYLKRYGGKQQEEEEEEEEEEEQQQEATAETAEGNREEEGAETEYDVDGEQAKKRHEGADRDLLTLLLNLEVPLHQCCHKTGRTPYELLSLTTIPIVTAHRALRSAMRGPLAHRLLGRRLFGSSATKASEEEKGEESVININGGEVNLHALSVSLFFPKKKKEGKNDDDKDEKEETATEAEEEQRQRQDEEGEQAQTKEEEEEEEKPVGGSVIRVLGTIPSTFHQQPIDLFLTVSDREGEGEGIPQLVVINKGDKTLRESTDSGSSGPNNLGEVRWVPIQSATASDGQTLKEILLSSKDRFLCERSTISSFSLVSQSLFHCWLLGEPKGERLLLCVKAVQAKDGSDAPTVAAAVAHVPAAGDSGVILDGLCYLEGSELLFIEGIAAAATTAADNCHQVLRTLIPRAFLEYADPSDLLSMVVEALETAAKSKKNQQNMEVEREAHQQEEEKVREEQEDTSRWVAVPRAVQRTDDVAPLAPAQKEEEEENGRGPTEEGRSEPAADAPQASSSSLVAYLLCLPPTAGQEGQSRLSHVVASAFEPQDRSLLAVVGTRPCLSNPSKPPIPTFEVWSRSKPQCSGKNESNSFQKLWQEDLDSSLRPLSLSWANDGSTVFLLSSPDAAEKQKNKQNNTKKKEEEEEEASVSFYSVLALNTQNFKSRQFHLDVSDDHQCNQQQQTPTGRAKVRLIPYIVNHKGIEEGPPSPPGPGTSSGSRPRERILRCLLQEEESEKEQKEASSSLLLPLARFFHGSATFL